MTDAINDAALKHWFCGKVLPLEPGLTRFIRRNWRNHDEIADLRQEIYEKTLVGARSGIPDQASAYLYAVARNHLINRAKRAQIVSFELVADLDRLEFEPDFLGAERHLEARDELRRAQEGLENLPPRCREIVRLRRIDGLSTKEAADRAGVSVDTVEKQMVNGMRALVDYMLGGSGRIRRNITGRKAEEYK